MKYILSILLFFLLVAPLAAQNDQDRVIFKAMQDEMQRNKEQLVLPGMQRPYYLSYTLGRYRSFEVRASLGGIVNAYETPWNSQGAVQMFWVMMTITMILFTGSRLHNCRCRRI